MKKILTAAFALLLCFTGAAFAASGPTKEVLFAGSDGLKSAETECAHLIGTHDWHSCVATYDRQYILLPGGKIVRGIVKDPSVTTPNTVDMVCDAVGVFKGGKIVWEIPSDPTCRPAKK